MFSVIGGVLIVGGLYMVLWGKSKETIKETNLGSSNNTQDFEATEVVVVSTATDHDDNSDYGNNSRTNSKSNIVVTKDCDESTKSGPQPNDSTGNDVVTEDGTGSLAPCGASHTKVIVIHPNSNIHHER